MNFPRPAHSCLARKMERSGPLANRKERLALQLMHAGRLVATASRRKFAGIMERLKSSGDTSPRDLYLDTYLRLRAETSNNAAPSFSTERFRSTNW